MQWSASFWSQTPLSVTYFFYTIFYFKVAVARREEIIKRQDEAIRSLEVTQLLITFFLLITGKFVYLVIPLAVGSFEVSIYILAESL